MSHSKRAFQPPLFAQLCRAAPCRAEPRRYFSEWRPDRARAPTHSEGAAPVSSSSPRGTAEPDQSRRSVGQSGQFNFLKLQCPFFFFFLIAGRGRDGRQTAETAQFVFFFGFFKVKAHRHCSWKVFLFSFLLNVKSHVSRSPVMSRLSAYVQNRHHSVITSFFKRNKYHICVHIFTNWKDSRWW